MPYTSGETPEVGDYVKNKYEQPGTVTVVDSSQGGQEQVSIRWDDGGADLPLTDAAEFSLISRSNVASVGLSTADILKWVTEPEERPPQVDGAVSLADRAIQYDVVPPTTVKTMSGMQLLAAIKDGTLPAPPIQRTLDFRIVEVERGFAAFVGTPKFEYYNPIGSVHGGYTAALLDSCMACAVHSALETGYSYATLEIKINYVRAITTETGEVRAEGKIINAGKRIATAEGRLCDSAGMLYAHGTTTCLIVSL
jgi:uncharacterized protein (TIGR00369 family)